MNNINVGSFSWTHLEFALLMLEKKDEGQLTLPEFLGIVTLLYPGKSPVQITRTLREFKELMS